MEKIKISADTLYMYLVDHDITITRLSDYMGVSNGIVMGCFRHNPNKQGNPLSFSAANIKRMNEAIMRIAEDMRKGLLVFGTEQTYTNRHGAVYDPGLVSSVKQHLGKFFKLRNLTERVLGWNGGKYNLTISSPKSKIYGNISKDDADRLNAELLAVAGVLSSYEVVADGDVLPALHDAIEQPAVEESVPTGTPMPTAPQADNGTPVEETEYTLDDLYHAFGEEKKSCAARLRNTLERQGVSTLKEFLLLTPGQLLDMEGMGSGTLGLIHKALKKMGVRW